MILEKPKTLGSPEYHAFIEYSDLIEINKAYNKLQQEVNADITLNPEYLENKFISNDDFRIGYYVEKEKAHWFIRLDYHYGSWLDLKKIEDFAEFLRNMQKEIENLKNNE